ncbi:unnamed protein product [Pseudo-nitzschia multistriata]|uniref:Transmembrane protein n=1 Tax=Pseudo-nitzschia multistriata TaxID=183589 RepID=A0A448ZPE6_9STRA|nr:unnamed protein product [Pseudo-nitzschia multistriata]
MPGNSNDLGSMPEDNHPLASFLKLGDSTTPGTDERNMLFMVAHIGFFAFNSFNVLYILVVQGIIERELQRNNILKIALGACLCQLMSCIACVFIGLNRNAHGSIENFAGLGIALHYSVLGVSCCVSTAIYCFLQGYIHWDPDPTKLQNFQPFRKFIGVSTMFQLLAMARCLYEYHNGRIGFPPNDPARRSVVRMFQTCIFLDLFALGLAGTGMPVLQYPATGSTFSVLTLCSTFVGRMNFAREPEPMQGENGGMLLANDAGNGDRPEDIEAGEEPQNERMLILRRQRTP